MFENNGGVRSNAEMSAVFSEMDSISSLEEEQRKSLEGFFTGTDVFALLQTRLLLLGSRARLLCHTGA